MTNLPPENAASHIRNVLQALAQPRDAQWQGAVLSGEEVAAIRRRLTLALLEIELPRDTAAVPFTTAMTASGESYGEPVVGAKMDGAALPGQEPEGV